MVNRKLQDEIGVRPDAEEQLRACEERYRAILSAITSVFWSTDRNGAFVSPQPSWEAYTGQSWDECRGFGWDRAIHPDEREAVVADWKRAVAAGEVYDSEGRLWHAATQSYRHYTSRAVPVKQSDGTIREWVGILTDADERKHTELVHSRLAAIVESSRDAIIGKTIDSVITSWNPGAECIYGYRAEEATDKPISIIVPPDRREEYDRIMDRVRRGESVGPLETVRARKDGTRVDVSLSISPVRNSRREIIGASVIARDITEQVKAQEQMRRLVRSVEAAHEAVILTDTKGIISFINPAFTRLTGYESSEVIGQSPRILKSGRQDSETYQRIWETIRRGDTWSGEIINRRKDGSLYDAHLTVAPVLDPAGQIEGFVGVQRDITERLRAEKALHETQERYRLTVHAALDAVITSDGKGRITVWNPQAETVFGWKAEEVLGKSLSETIIPPRYRAAHERGIAHFHATGEGPLLNQRFETTALHRDGHELPVELAVIPLGMGDETFFSAYLRDLSERKRADEQFRLAVEASPSGMVMVEESGRITMVNSELERMFGYKRNELIGQQIELLVPERFRAEHPKLRALYHSRPSVRSMGGGRDLFGRRKGGSEFPIEVGLSPVQSGEGPMVLAAIVDITERKRVEQILTDHLRETDDLNTALMKAKKSLDATVEELRRSNKDLEDFAYVASHDLKEPLRGIHNYAQFLLEDYAEKLDDEGKSKLFTLTRLTKRMEALIDSLLQFSRIGRVDLSFENVDLDRIVADVVDMFQVTPEAEGAQVTVSRPLPTVRCDGARIAEVFRNLIVNAAKYNDKPEKSIEIGWYDDVSRMEACTGGAPVLHGAGRSSANPAGPVFFVRDNGIGIPPRHHETVFRIFKRLHARDKFGGGTGAGLTIVKKIVDRHGGNIWIDSVEGEGTTFYFTLHGIKDHAQASKREITAHSAG